MPKLPILKEGDIIDVIAPGRAGDAAQLEQVKQWIASLGYVARIPEMLLGEDLLCSNRDAVRLEQAIAAFQAKDSRAIWCLRGGYGATRIMDKLVRIKKPKVKKILIGFSDNTALHLLCNQQFGWPSIHAPVLSQIVEKKVDDTSIAMVEDTLKRAIKTIEYVLEPLNDAAAKKGKIKSQIIGGNLTLVQCSLATDWQVEAKNKILFLEDCDERDYRVDRALTQLASAGVFKKAKAVIFGSFTVPDAALEVPVAQVLSRFAAAQQIPVFKTDQVGHKPTNYPLLLGTGVKLIKGNPARLEMKR